MKVSRSSLLVAVLAVLVLGVGQAGATTVDLISGNSGSIDSALFYWVDTGSTGTGVIHSFVRLNPGGSATFEQGYNTDARPLQFDENSSPQFTLGLPLSTVPVVNINGTDYREFLLDINQTRSDPFISMVGLQIWLRGAADLKGYTAVAGQPTAGSFASGSQIWGMGQGDRVDLDFTRNPGSGYGDMFAYIPNDRFTGPNQWVYLYSAFGGNGVPEPPFQTNDGFEEWAVREGGTPSQVPEPSTLLLLGTGMALASLTAYRRRAK